MVMSALIGPKAQAANRPLLVCRGLCLLVSLINSFADGAWQGLIYQAGTGGMVGLTGMTEEGEKRKYV